MPLAKYTRFRYITASPIRGDNDIVVIMQGVTGPTGATGPVGPKGATGAQGDDGIAGEMSGGSFEHIQTVPSNLWTVTHNLGHYPGVVIFDEDENDVEGDITYVSSDVLTIGFNSPIAGRAVCNVVIVTGPTGTNTPGSTHQHVQTVPSTVWVVTHGLGKHPNVTAIDNDLNLLDGEINHLSNDILSITFDSACSGTAVCN